MIGTPGAFDHWASVSWYNKDHPKAEFKIGEEVEYHGKFDDLHGIWEILGLNWIEGTTFEYALCGFPYLIWEDEIEKVEKE